MDSTAGRRLAAMRTMLEYLSYFVNTGSSVLRSQHGNRIVGPADMVRGKPPAQPQPHGAAYRVLSPCLCRRPMHVLSNRVPRYAGGSSSEGNYRCVFEMEPLEDKLRPCMRARNLSGIAFPLLVECLSLCVQGGSRGITDICTPYIRESQAGLAGCFVRSRHVTAGAET